MISSRIVTVATITFLLLVLCLGVKPVKAQQVDLAIAPPTIELLVKPGTQVRIPFTITNRSDEMSLSPLIKTFTLVDGGMSIGYGSADGLPMKALFYDEKSELTKSFTLKKGEARKISVDLIVPNLTPEGDYYLVFIAETQPELLDKQYSARIKTQIASPMLVTVSKSGKTQAKGTIDVFEVVGKIFDSFDSVPVTLRVQNQGENAIYTGGTITIRGSLGEKVTYPLESHNILTRSGRLMVSKLSDGKYTAVIKGFFLGRYTVSAVVTLADGAVQLSRSTSFVAFPFKIIFIAILGAAIGLMVLRKRR